RFSRDWSSDVCSSDLKGSIENRSQLYLDIASGPFFGFNRPGAKPNQGLIQSFWAQGMQGGHKNTYDSIAAFSATDFREDLKKFDVPTLVIHGDDDQVVPIDLSGRALAALVKGAELIVYPGGPHGITDTHKARLNQAPLDLLRRCAARPAHDGRHCRPSCCRSQAGVRAGAVTVSTCRLPAAPGTVPCARSRSLSSWAWPCWSPPCLPPPPPNRALARAKAPKRWTWPCR